MFLSPKSILRFLGKAIAIIVVTIIVGIAILAALVHHEHSTPLTLPEPTGRFAVGRSTYVWPNTAVPDELAPVHGARREVFVWIWYPAARNASAGPASYVPDAWRAADEKYTGVLLSQFLTRDLSLVHAHSLQDPPVAPDETSYPVVIMRAGGGAPTTDFTTLAEDLASHGYIVVGFDAPYRTYLVVSPAGSVITRPPGNDPENLPAEGVDALVNRLLPMWVTDTKFVVDQLQDLNAHDPAGRFTRRLDMRRLGMFGHSFGGAQALQFCHEDSRCKAGIDIDGAPYGSVVQDGVKQPFMFIVSDHSHDPPDPASGEIRANFESIYQRLPNGRYFVTIRGTNHFSFSDQILLKSEYVIGAMQKMGLGSEPPRRGLAVTSDYVHTFFDVYLKGTADAELANISKQYPEVAEGTASLR